MAITINIGVEDALSEVVIRRMLNEVRRGYIVKTRYPTSGKTYERVAPSGYGFLKSNMAAFNEAARDIPYLILADLDANPCAATLGGIWLKQKMHPNLIFRVAIREVEAWLLADRDSMAAFMHLPISKFPANPELIGDPKQHIVNLAKSSPLPDIVEGIAPAPGSFAQVGPNYPPMMISFVRSNWDISSAASNCESLRRALAHLKRFKPV